MTTSVSYEVVGKVARITFDDGKANALSHETLADLGAALTRAEEEAKSVLFVGRPGKFCAGFNLKEMMAGQESARALVKAGAEFLVRVFVSPRPTVIACTGHALAAGGIWMMTADQRFAVSGPFKLGLNEVSLGMTPPLFLMEIARHRLSRRHLTRAVTQAEIYTPERAVDAGFVDTVTSGDKLLESALAEAARLAELPSVAFGEAKTRERGAVAAEILAGLDADMSTFDISPPG